MTERSIPARMGLLLGGVGSLLALLPAALAGAVPPLLLGGIGSLVLLSGIGKRSRSIITVGTLGLYGNVLLAGVVGVGAVALLAGTLGTVIAWDSAEYAVVVQRQLSPVVNSRRTQFLHATSTTAVVVAAGTVSVLLSLVATSGSVAVMVLFLIGVLALVAGLTR